MVAKIAGGFKFATFSEIAETNFSFFFYKNGRATTAGPLRSYPKFEKRVLFSKIPRHYRQKLSLGSGGFRNFAKSDTNFAELLCNLFARANQLTAVAREKGACRASTSEKRWAPHDDNETVQAEISPHINEYVASLAIQIGDY